FESGLQQPDSLMKDGKEVLVPDNPAKLASRRYYGFGKDFTNWGGGEIEMFRDKMQRRYKDLFKKD
ncbi:MAG: hypothetical protein QG635_2283, partial [Bacteroidota bacterium]|nr:hypothetical protein [Bacteroidota bacterium]